MSVYNTQRTITLNTKGSLSGPYYRVEFSNDCINYYTSSYTASINPVYLNGHDGSASYSSTVYASMSIVNLPTVGSTASILVPNNASCIKLINLSNSCDGNEYIENISSTTTSTSTSTTSTSTTSTSTTTSTTTTSTTTSTTTTTTAAPAYNYYTFTPCTGGVGTDYRSILSLALNAVYAFQASPPTRACYTITSITAGVNANDLPTIYGPKSDCGDTDCQQL